MSRTRPALALQADEVPARSRPSVYPEPFASQMQGRTKRALGDAFGLRNFGVNLTTLLPGAVSALRHHHRVQDEFIYVLEGAPTLITDRGEQRLGPGMCVGFPAGSGDAHRLVNRSNRACAYLEVGDRSPGDHVMYPDDDLMAMSTDCGGWCFTHKDGAPY